MIPPNADSIGRADRPLAVVVDGAEVQGVYGQTASASGRRPIGRRRELNELAS